MFYVTYLLKRRRDITHDEFKDYYESTHSRLALKYMDGVVLEYRRFYPESVGGTPLLSSADAGSGSDAELPFDCVTQMTLADRQSYSEMRRRLSDPAIAETLAASEERFLDRPGVIMLTGSMLTDLPSIA